MRVGTLTIIARSGRRNRLATLGSMTSLSAAMSNCSIAISLVALRHSSIEILPSAYTGTVPRYSNRLPGRPAHLPSAEKMVVHMKYCLAGVGAGIDDDAKSALGDSQVLGQLPGYLKNFSNERAVARFDIEHARDVLARNNENMHGRPGLDVL